MNNTFLVPEEAKKRRAGFVQTAALTVICIYALSMYVGYINTALLSVQSLSLYAMVGLTFILILQRGNVKLNQYQLWYGIFILFSLISCLYSANRNASFAAVYGLVVVWLFALVLNNAVTQKKHMEMIFLSLIVGSVLLVAFLVVTGQFEDAGSRFGEELTGNANVFASIYMIAAAVSVYYIYSSEGLRKKLPYFAALVIQIYALSLSGGRKYFIFPFILMYVMSLQKKDKQQRSRFIRVTVIAVAAVLLLYYVMINVEFLYNTIGYRFEDFLEYFFGRSTQVEGGTIIREKMIERGLELWAESPLFGHGLNAFASIGGFGVYSHNNFIEMLCNHGVVGFVIYYGFYAYVLTVLLKNGRSDVMRHFLVGFVVCLLVYEYGAVAYNTLVTQMFLAFAVIYGKLVRQSAETTSDGVSLNEATDKQ